MHRRRNISIGLMLELAFCSLSSAQSRNVPASVMPLQSGSGQGQLTVTLTITPSVGVVMGADGQPQLICANCNDPGHNVSAVKMQPDNSLASRPEKKNPSNASRSSPR